jgi:hypothetical protein
VSLRNIPRSLRLPSGAPAEHFEAGAVVRRQMSAPGEDDPIDNLIIIYERDNGHLASTRRTDQWIDLVDLTGIISAQLFEGTASGSSSMMGGAEGPAPDFLILPLCSLE